MYFNTFETSSVLSEGFSKLTIIVDEGHGGEDGGAVGVTGTLEKDINLNISKYIKAYFDLTDINCVLTRNDDTLLYNENQANKKKYYDIRNRYSFCTNIDNPVFVSIHQNKFPVEKYFGLQVYYSPNNEQSKIVADNIQNTCVEYIQKNNSRKIKQAQSNIFLLDNLQCPAVLVECGFLSNATEEKMLCDTEYQKKIAFCIYKSLMDYLEQSNQNMNSVQ